MQEVRPAAEEPQRQLQGRMQAGLSSGMLLEAFSGCGMCEKGVKPEILTPEHGVGGSLWGEAPR